MATGLYSKLVGRIRTGGIPGAERWAATPEAWWTQRLHADLQAAVVQVPVGERDGELSAKRQRHAVLAQAALAALVPTAPNAETSAAAPADAAVLDAVQALAEQVGTALERADRSGTLIDHLDRENRALRSRAAERSQQPVLRSIIALYDDLQNLRRQAEAGGEAHATTLATLEQQTLEILRRHGVEAFAPKPGDPFDGNDVEAIDRRVTTDPAAELTVAEVHRSGFTHADQTLRPAAVTVFRFGGAAA